MKRILALVALAAATPALGQSGNDFPTQARVEYVLVCMEANGRSPENLRRCSCKVDELASLIRYDDLVSAETVLRMQNMNGGRAEVFRGAGMMSTIVDKYRAAEAEAELVCF